MCDVEWVFVAALRKFESPSYRYQNFSRFPAKNAKASAAGTGFAGSPFEVRTTNSSCRPQDYALFEFAAPDEGFAYTVMDASLGIDAIIIPYVFPNLIIQHVGTHDGEGYRSGGYMHVLPEY
jgi:hypothetical protein